MLMGVAHREDGEAIWLSNACTRHFKAPFILRLSDSKDVLKLLLI